MTKITFIALTGPLRGEDIRKSDINAYRIHARFPNDKGVEYYAEFGRLYDNTLWVARLFPLERGERKPTPGLIVRGTNYKYIQKDILKFLNEETDSSFNEIEILQPEVLK